MFLCVTTALTACHAPAGPYSSQVVTRTGARQPLHLISVSYQRSIAPNSNTPQNTLRLEMSGEDNNLENLMYASYFMVTKLRMLDAAGKPLRMQNPQYDDIIPMSHDGRQVAGTPVFHSLDQQTVDALTGEIRWNGPRAGMVELLEGYLIIREREEPVRLDIPIDDSQLRHEVAPGLFAWVETKINKTSYSHLTMHLRMAKDDERKRSIDSAGISNLRLLDKNGQPIFVSKDMGRFANHSGLNATSYTADLPAMPARIVADIAPALPEQIVEFRLANVSLQ